MILSITELVGRFHPVLVHLPIGILLLASLFHFLSVKEKFIYLRPAVSVALLWGLLSAVASCISGFLLSKTDDYDAALISKHQWLGIATAVVSGIAYYLSRKESKFLPGVMVLMVLLIVITGHLGGSITHGSDYLVKAFSSGKANAEAKQIPPVANVQEAAVYADIVKPILETKCYGCHGPNKQKGKLRLDGPEFILKGGKNGKAVIPGKTEGSELIERIFLPGEDDDHMPPKAKPQLSKQEMDLLHWWVSTGAGFNNKVKETPQTEKIKPALLALQSRPVQEEVRLPDIPEAKVEKAADAIIKQLKGKGIAVSPVAQNSNYLSVNFIAADSNTKNDLVLLESLKKQIIWLRLGDTKITDAELGLVGKLTTLTRLYLERTPVTDKGIASLKNLSSLTYLNLTGTKVTAAGIRQLSTLANLKQVYLYQVSVSGNEFNELKKVFPKTLIDTGGYKIQALEGDTTRVKAPKIN